MKNNMWMMLVLLVVTSFGVKNVYAQQAIEVPTDQVPAGSISGSKFNDANNDSVWDHEIEKGLSGWTIELSGGVIDGTVSVVTDEQGNYSFTSLPDGTYTLCEVPQSDWAQTFPTEGPACNSGNGYTLRIVEGQAATEKNFGNFRKDTAEESVVPKEPAEKDSGNARSRSGGRRHSTETSHGDGKVLGASIGPDGSTLSCEPYIKSYIKLGKQNDLEDVMRLQTFLNEYLKAHLPVTGFYGPLSFEAVKKFQLAESKFVYDPWIAAGLPFESAFPSGYVYKTTKWRINNLKCPNAPFPLPILS